MAKAAKKQKQVDQGCSTCEHSVFDPIWGEWKCKVLHHRIYHPIDTVDCIYYEKSTTEKIIVEDDDE